MTKLSKYTTHITSSSIRKMFNLSQGLDNIISFALGEPDFNTPINIANAAIKAIKAGKTKYTNNAGLIELRTIIAKKAKEDINVEYNPIEEIIITAGAMEALIMAMMIILDPGDEVIVSNPCWTNYPQQINMIGAVPKPVKVYEKDGFLFTEENLMKAITDKTKAILINSPSNPTGGVYDYDSLNMVARIAKKHDLFVISDEVYKHIIFDKHKYLSIAEFSDMKERTIVIDSFSKTYAMTGWRVGYAAANKEIISNMIKYQENMVACVSTPSQYAAIEALSGSQEDRHYMLDQYSERRNIVFEEINKINGLSCNIPKGTFYAFINIEKTGLSSEEFAMKLMQLEHVVVIPGTGFGDAGEGFIRLSFATSIEAIREGIRRIKRFTDNINS